MKRRINLVIKYFNKQYRESKEGVFLRKIQEQVVEKIQTVHGGKVPLHTFFGDDLILFYRNLSLLEDVDFIDALVSCKASEVLRARLWRAYFFCWSMNIRADYSGSIMDLGCYNGETLEVALRYIKSLRSRSCMPFPHMSVIAADIFDDPPIEARKIEHGPGLHEKVCSRLAGLCDFEVIKGILPSSLIGKVPSNVSWAHIDLNDAEADASTFQAILPKLTKGAHVIFDDYGFSRYSDTKELIDRVISKERLNPVVELPTGQGFYIH